MNKRKEKKTVQLTIRCTPTELSHLKHAAERLDMKPTAYAHDKLFNGKERNHYARRKMCRTLVTASHHIDQIYNFIANTDSDYIAKDSIIPLLNQASKELNNIWNH